MALTTIKNALDIPGWTNSKQHQEYANLVLKLPKNPKILEIGCGWGRSTWAWLDVLPSTATYCILDNFCLSSRWCFRSQYHYYRSANPKIAKLIKRWCKRSTSQKEIFNYFMLQHSNQQIIKTIWDIDSDIWITSDKFTNNWDLVYLDDRHEYEVMKTWLSLFSNVPIVCGDDYHPNFKGVVDAVKQYASNTSASKNIPKNTNFFVINNEVDNS